MRARTPVIAGTIGLALLSLTQLYLTWLIKEWVEGPVLARNGALLAPLIARATVAAAIGMFSLFLSRATLAAAGQRLLQSLREDASTALLRAPVSVVGNASTGEWLSRLFNDVNALSGFLGTVARRLVTETVILTGAVTLMFVLSWRLALVTFAVIPLAAGLFAGIGAQIRRWSARAQSAAGALTATVNEQLRAFTTVKSYQAEELVAGRLHSEGDDLRRRVVRSELWSAALISMVFLLAGGAFIGILIYGTSHIGLAAAEQATFLAFCLYAGQAIEPARRLGEVHGLLQQSLAAAVRVFEVIDLEPEADASLTRAPRNGAIEFKHVSFAYEGSRDEVLRDVTFRVEDGEHVAIAGATGCGKTTLTRLLLRFAHPHAGRITYGGVELDELSLRDLRGGICLVEQEPFVFSGSLRENILLGCPGASKRALEEAVQMAQLESLRLDAPLREAGRDLSGGERQRIALARAIVRNPRVLLLDEATSAIDGETEATLFRALGPWLAMRTVIAVSHRLATVRRFPRVLLLDEGRIAADGDSVHLLRDSPLFRALFSGQIERDRDRSVA